MKIFKALNEWKKWLEISLKFEFSVISTLQNNGELQGTF